MPTFMLRPNRLPEGWFSSISGESGSLPVGPAACVITPLHGVPSLSSTDLNVIFVMVVFPQQDWRTGTQSGILIIQFTRFLMI
jgi:hypothetical protein